MRVYCIDWYENRERALEQILKELKLAESGSSEDEPAEETASYVFDAEKIRESGVDDDVVRNEALIPYKECEIAIKNVDKDAFNPSDEKYAKLIKNVLKAEQPVTENYLCKRLAKALGFGHAGPHVQKAVSLALSGLYQDPLSVDGICSFWLDKKSASNFKGYRAPSSRSITEIPVIEIANAIKEVAKEEFSLPKDKIPTLVARKLGFSSAGAKICDVINKTVNLLEEEKAVTVTNGLVSLSRTSAV